MFAEFSQSYLQATLMVSLLSVWVLVGLFHYLNRYTRREYFTIWTAAWLTYALWLTLSLTWPSPDPVSLASMVKQSCVAVSAACLLWGTLRFLDIHVRQTLFGLFILFLILWTFAIPHVAANILQIQLPVFILLGAGSAFAGACFYRLRRKLPYVGAGMLALGFLLWGVYLAFFPVAQQYPDLHAAAHLVAAVLQLFIAVSMIVLVLEEVRYRQETMLAEIATVRSEKEQLQARVLTSEEQLRRAYDQVRLTEGAQQAYDELRRTQQTVVQQERLRALGEMASGMAHDINNALSPISAYTELLRITVPNLSEEAVRYFDHVRSATQDVAGIVARMREFYRQRTASELRQPIEVPALLAGVADLTRPRWRDEPQRHGISIELTVHCETGLPPLLGDPGELREALTNLVFNAVDALPHGGHITLQAALRPATRPQAAPELALEIVDDGIGMDETTRRRCLEPFFTTKAQRGTGLGLSMVYGMMRRHEGHIEIDSAPNRGTTIRLRFPLPSAGPTPAEIPTPALASGRPLRLLCIDDEAKLRTLFTQCLSAFGHQVEVADSGPAGIAAFRAAVEAGRAYDLVLTDLGMPGMDGNEVARALKQISPATPLIMLTGWGAQLNAETGGAQPVDAVLPKPPNLELLVSTIRRLAG